MKEYKYKVKGAEYVVKINEVEGNIAKVDVNGITFEVETDRPMKHMQIVRPVVTHVSHVASTSTTTKDPQPAAPAAPVHASGTSVKAPLPGTVNAVSVTVGQQVKKGQVVVVLEAMKMENNIVAECDGTITSVNVTKGDSVREGAILVTIG